VKGMLASVVLMAHFAVAGPVLGQTSPRTPLLPLFCAVTFVDDYLADEPTITIRNDCDDTVIWVGCLRGGDMSAEEHYEGLLEPGEEAYMNTEIFPGLGVKFHFSGYSNFEGHEVPWPEC